jgi:ribosomal protein L37AE/L43A
MRLKRRCLKPKKRKPHHCKIPGVSRRTRIVDIGSTWECKKCRKIWTVTSVTRPLGDGKNYTMIWETDAGQRVTMLDPMYTDV